MDGSAVNAIRDLALKNSVIEHEGAKFVPQSYKELRFQVDRPGQLDFNTLQSLADFVKENPNDMEFMGAIVVINQDRSVSLYSDLEDGDQQRTHLVYTKMEIEPFPFNQFIPAEMFNIYLQTRFIYTDSAQDLFKITSRLKVDEGVTLSDDGLSARVTIQKGISAASADVANIPTRVILAPYRIFPECDQPLSQFILRLKQDENKGAYIGLWETDGGLWKVDAKQSIKKKLIEYGLELPIYA